MLDPNPAISGAFLDLAHASASTIHSVTLNQPGTLWRADYVFHSAGLNSQKGASRYQVYQKNREIVERIFAEEKFRKETCFIVISNPVDLIASEIAQVTHAPQGKVLAVSTALECLRLAWHLSSELGCDAGEIEAMVLGEHGETQVPVFSQCRLKGEPLHPRMRPAFERAAFLTKNAAKAIRQTQDATLWGVARSTYDIFEALTSGEETNLILGVSPNAWFQQQLNCGREVFLGLPARVGKGKAHPVDELILEDAEWEKLRASAARLKSFLNRTD